MRGQANASKTLSLSDFFSQHCVVPSNEVMTLPAERRSALHPIHTRMDSPTLKHCLSMHQISSAYWWLIERTSFSLISLCIFSWLWPKQRLRSTLRKTLRDMTCVLLLCPIPPFCLHVCGHLMYRAENLGSQAARDIKFVSTCVCFICYKCDGT